MILDLLVGAQEMRFEEVTFWHPGVAQTMSVLAPCLSDSGPFCMASSRELAGGILETPSAHPLIVQAKILRSREGH